MEMKESKKAQKLYSKVNERDIQMYPEWSKEQYEKIIHLYPDSPEAKKSIKKINEWDSILNKAKEEKEKDIKSSEIKGIILAGFGILLLVITFLISLSLGTPEKLEDFEGYYFTLKALNIFQYSGLVLTLSGIVWMIYNFYHSWRTEVNEIKDDINTLLKYQVGKDIKDFEK